jgi:hypothetical protein
MKRYVVVSLVAAFGAASVFAQQSFIQNATRLPDPHAVAYVYVSSNYSGTSNRIEAFAAGRDGNLTPIAGSPFAGDVSGMAVNGKYLFGAGTNGTDVDTFGITWDGGLKQVQTTNVQNYNGGGCSGLGSLVLDHTGADLYVSVLQGGLCDHSAYQSFRVDKPTGQLKYLGVTAQTFLFNDPLSFIGNNVYAYGSLCIDYQGNYLDTFAGFRRDDNGILTAANVNAPTPATKASDSFYCRAQAAADRTNHLAVSLQAIDNSTSTPQGMPQLATYTEHDGGNLTTASKYWNMPSTPVGDVTALSMSPSGRLLAVGGTSGLQVFHFNEDDPITHYTGLLMKDSISQVSPAPELMFWDNDNHLYALSPTAGKLYVFTVTPDDVRQAPGSPYTIQNPQSLIVQPRSKLHLSVWHNAPDRN